METALNDIRNICFSYSSKTAESAEISSERQKKEFAVFSLDSAVAQSLNAALDAARAAYNQCDAERQSHLNNFNRCHQQFIATDMRAQKAELQLHELNSKHIFEIELLHAHIEKLMCTISEKNSQLRSVRQENRQLQNMTQVQQSVKAAPDTSKLTPVCVVEWVPRTTPNEKPTQYKPNCLSNASASSSNSNTFNQDSEAFGTLLASNLDRKSNASTTCSATSITASNVEHTLNASPMTSTASNANETSRSSSGRLTATSPELLSIASLCVPYTLIASTIHNFDKTQNASLTASTSTNVELASNAPSNASYATPSASKAYNAEQISNLLRNFNEASALSTATTPSGPTVQLSSETFNLVESSARLETQFSPASNQSTTCNTIIAHTSDVSTANNLTPTPPMDLSAPSFISTPSINLSAFDKEIRVRNMYIKTLISELSTYVGKTRQRELRKWLQNQELAKFQSQNDRTVQLLKEAYEEISKLRLQLSDAQQELTEVLRLKLEPVRQQQATETDPSKDLQKSNLSFPKVALQHLNPEYNELKTPMTEKPNVLTMSQTTKYLFELEHTAKWLNGTKQSIREMASRLCLSGIQEARKWLNHCIFLDKRCVELESRCQAYEAYKKCLEVKLDNVIAPPSIPPNEMGQFQTKLPSSQPKGMNYEETLNKLKTHHEEQIKRTIKNRATLESNLKDAKVQIKNLQDEISKLQNCIAQNEMQKARKKIQRLETEFGEAQTQNRASYIEIKKLQIRLSQTDMHLDASQNEVKKLQNNLSQARERSHSSDKEIEKLLDKINSIEQQKSGLQNNLERLQTYFRNIEEKNQASESEVSKLLTDLTTAEERAKSYEKEITTFQLNLNNVEMQRDSLTEKTGRFQNDLAKATATCAASEQKNNKLQTSLKKAEAKARRSNKKVKLLTECLSNATKKSKTFQTTLNDVKTQRDTFKQQLNKLKNDLSESKKNSTLSNQEIAKLKISLNRAEQTSKASEQKIKSLQVSLEQAESRANRLPQEVEDLLKYVTNVLEKSETSEKEIERLQITSFNEDETMQNAAKTETETIQTRLNQLKQNYQSSQDKIKTLQTSLDQARSALTSQKQDFASKDKINKQTIQSLETSLSQAHTDLADQKNNQTNINRLEETVQSAKDQLACALAKIERLQSDREAYVEQCASIERQLANQLVEAAQREQALKCELLRLSQHTADAQRIAIGDRENIALRSQCDVLETRVALLHDELRCVRSVKNTPDGREYCDNRQTSNAAQYCAKDDEIMANKDCKSDRKLEQATRLLAEKEKKIKHLEKMRIDSIMQANADTEKIKSFKERLLLLEKELSIKSLQVSTLVRSSSYGRSAFETSKELQKTVSEHEAHMSSLEAQLEDQKTKIAELTHSNSLLCIHSDEAKENEQRLQKKISDLQTELLTEEERQKALETEQDLLVSKISDLEAKLQRKTEEVCKAEEKLNNNQQKTNKASKYHQKLEDKLKRYSKRLHESKHELETTQESEKSLKLRVNQLEEKLENRQNELAECQKQNADLKQTQLSLTSQKNQALTTIESLQHKLRNSGSFTDETTQNLRQKVIALEAKLFEFNSNLDKSTNINRVEKNKTAQITKKYQLMKQRLQHQADAMLVSQKLVFELEAKLEKSAAQISDLNSQLNRAEELNDSLKLRVNTGCGLKAQLDSLQSQNEALRSRKNSLKHSVAELKASNGKLTQKLASKKSDLATATAQVAELNEKVQKSTEKSTKLRGEVEKLTAQLNHKLEHSHETEKLKNLLQSTTRAKQEEMHKLKEKYDKIISEMETKNIESSRQNVILSEQIDSLKRRRESGDSELEPPGGKKFRCESF